MSRLNPENLSVQSFATSDAAEAGIGDCCTGCVSGCGINPTAGYCESKGDGTVDQTAL
jgi:hypothetical protein